MDQLSRRLLRGNRRALARRAPRVALPALLLFLAPILVPGARGGCSNDPLFGPETTLRGVEDPNNSIDENETAIAANPLDPLNLVAGFKTETFATGGLSCYATFTIDGGTTWAPGGRLPIQQDDFSKCVDPSLVADRAGRFAYAYLNLYGHVQNGIVVNYTADVLVARSTDGGRTFPGFTVAARGERDVSNADKPYLAVDSWPQSAHAGTLYLAYTFWSNPNLEWSVRVVVSRDAGATWSAPAVLARSSTLEVFGGLPVVAPDGAAYIFYSEYGRGAPTTLAIRFSKSKDGGRTWSAPATIAANLPSPGIFKLRNGSSRFDSDYHSGFWANSWPTAAAAPDGTLYVAWVDFPAGTCFSVSGFSHCENADVRLAVSRSAGKRWSAPVRVGDDPTHADQFFPWIATHPDGRLSVLMMDKRLDPANEMYDAFYTSTCDGAAFRPPTRLSGTSYLVGQQEFIGDYTAIAATATGVFPVWTAGPNNNKTDVVTARGARQP